MKCHISDIVVSEIKAHPALTAFRLMEPDDKAIPLFRNLNRIENDGTFGAPPGKRQGRNAALLITIACPYGTLQAFPSAWSEMDGLYEFMVTDICIGIRGLRGSQKGNAHGASLYPVAVLAVACQDD